MILTALHLCHNADFASDVHRKQWPRLRLRAGSCIVPILSRVERIRSLLILRQLKNESLQVLEFLDFGGGHRLQESAGALHNIRWLCVGPCGGLVAE
jgi:hypothetical protein